MLIVGASIAAAVRWLTAPRGARDEWAVAITWIAIATGCQALLRSLAPFSFDQIMVSDGANSFYTVTQQYGAENVLTRFAELRGNWPMHANSNMPGKLLLLYALELVSNDPTLLSWLLLAVSNLGGLLLYLLVRDLFGDRQIALYALVLYLFVPAKLFFLPLMNTVTPVVTFACLLLFERWLQRTSLGYGIAAAVSLYMLVFFEPVPLVIGALVALILARALVWGDMPVKTLMTQSLFIIAAFLGMIALVWRLFDFNLADAFRRVAADAAAFNALENRPYGLWVWRNLVDFGFGVGICQVVLFWFAAADGLRWRADAVAQPADRPVLGGARRHAACARPHRRQSWRSDPPMDLPRVPVPGAHGVRLCPRAKSRCLRYRADADDRSGGAGHSDYRLCRPLSPLFRPNAQKAPKLRGLRGRFSGAWRMRSRTDGLS